MYKSIVSRKDFQQSNFTYLFISIAVHHSAILHMGVNLFQTDVVRNLMYVLTEKSVKIKRYETFILSEILREMLGNPISLRLHETTRVRLF